MRHPFSRSGRSALAAVLGALALVVALPAQANADVLTLLPQNADGPEQTFSPAYDYDGDGCYATAAIGADGTINPGLKLGGDVNGHCHDYAQLANANTYSREKCDNGWCAVMYASYFEKDQATLVRVGVPAQRLPGGRGLVRPLRRHPPEDRLPQGRCLHARLPLRQRQ